MAFNTNTDLRTKPALPVDTPPATGTIPPAERGDIGAPPPPPATGYHKPDPRFAAKYQGSGKVGGVYGVRGPQAPLFVTSNGVTTDVKGHAERIGELGLDPVVVFNEAYNIV